MSDPAPPAGPARQVLFVQGGGAGTHDDWDHRLVASLRAALGDGYEVRYPRMPHEDDPSASAWGPAIREHLADLPDGSVAVGHSVGGTLLLHVLTQPGAAASGTLAAVVLVAAPFVGEGGWPGDGFSFGPGLGERLPADLAVHVVHGEADDSVPPSHAGLHRGAVPQAQVHLLPGRDHQLGDDLREVAEVIRSCAPPASRDSG